MTAETPREVELCPHCDAVLPPGHPRFCIECGGALSGGGGAEEEGEQAVPPATGATVRLGNARVEQSVLGGTVRLPTEDAIPPGMWTIAGPPGAGDVIAVYVPLRAIVTGWSGLIDTGWQLVEQLPPERDSTSPRFRFETECAWFPAPGYGHGMQLNVRVGAEAEAQEGRSRRGFRYRTDYDPPMAVLGARWADASGTHTAMPIPRIQLMAPPRIPRVSDYREQIGVLPAEQAAIWTRQSKVSEVFHLLADRQQRTPAGRGLLLGAANSLGLFERFFGKGGKPRYHVRFEHPLICSWKEWQRHKRQIAARARELGLGLETDATVEWWLDQEGYDGVVFDDVADRYRYKRVAVAFRRSQVARVEGASG